MGALAEGKDPAAEKQAAKAAQKAEACDKTQGKRFS
jgi:hypothetical protein